MSCLPCAGCRNATAPVGEVFVLFELEEMPTAEIARVLGCPDASVRRQLQEARRKVEQFIREQPMAGVAP